MTIDPNPPEHQGNPPQTAERSASSSTWLRHAAQPLIVGIMVTCVSIAIVQFAASFDPTWNAPYILLAPILAALAGHYTRHIMHRQYISGTEGLRMQLIELLVMFLVLKFIAYVGAPLTTLVADMRLWQEDFYTFFDFKTLVTFILSALAWLAAGATVRDMEELGDPTLRERGANPPIIRMRNRFFIGGFIMLFFAGLARVRVAEILDLKRPPVPGLILNVLVYFVLGLTIFGQLQYTRLARAWKRRKIKIAPNLDKHWLKYSLIFMGIVLIIAFALPTGYTIGLLDLVAMLLGILQFIITLIFFLISLPLGWLLSLILGRPALEGTGIHAPTLPSQLTPEPTTEGAPLPPWWQIIRSVIAWGLFIALALYLIRSYLRDRPELIASLKRLKIVNILKAIWRAITDLWRNLGNTVREGITRITQRRGEQGETALTGTRRRRVHSLRERVFYLYMSLLDRARTEGYPRRETQTPYEYQRTLAPHLDEAQQEIQSMTEGFVNARYSPHPVEEETVHQLQAHLEHLTTALARLREQRASDNETKET